MEVVVVEEDDASPKQPRPASQPASTPASTPAGEQC